MIKKGQSTLEYAVIIAVVAAALIAIQIYMRRGIQGRLRSSVDDIGEQFSAGITTYNLTTNYKGENGTIITEESFGIEKTGVSESKVVAPANITQIKNESTSTGFSNEKLF